MRHQPLRDPKALGNGRAKKVTPNLKRLRIHSKEGAKKNAAGYDFRKRNPSPIIGRRKTRGSKEGRKG